MGRTKIALAKYIVWLTGTSYVSSLMSFPLLLFAIVKNCNVFSNTTQFYYDVFSNTLQFWIVAVSQENLLCLKKQSFSKNICDCWNALWREKNAFAKICTFCKFVMTYLLQVVMSIPGRNEGWGHEKYSIFISCGRTLARKWVCKKCITRKSCRI